MKTIHTIPVALAVTLLMFSCTSTNSGPSDLRGDRARTMNIDLNRSDCKLVLGRAYGESTGFNLLGFIPLSSPSESMAVDAMYENARQRGASPEGASRVFANTSIEKTSNYFILFSRPVIRASGDLVEYTDVPKDTAKRR